MKTWRFIGMVLLAVILCVNFTACSDDEEEKGESGNLNGIIIGELGHKMEMMIYSSSMLMEQA